MAKTSTHTWLSSHHYLFATQAKSGKPCTHTLLCGGVAVLPDAAAYRAMYERLAKDIVEESGRISLCENFPRIYGRWQAQTADGRTRRPPVDLVMRSVAVLGLPLERVADWLTGGERPPVTTRPPGQVDWRECVFALDMDYGPLTAASYRMEEIIKDMQLVQRVMNECGATPIATRCYICVADALGTMGVHAYFPFSAYFPEECMQLATIIVARLQEERPLHLGNGRFWHQIVDVGIYNGSLRLVGVKKGHRCEACQNRPAERERCATCRGAGVVFKDRRYLPSVYLNEHGQPDLRESRWMTPVADYLKAKAPAAPARSKSSAPAAPPEPSSGARAPLLTAREPSFLPIVAAPIAAAAVPRPIMVGDDLRCADYVKALLLMCSLRLVLSSKHTTFTPPPDSPRPTFPRAWVAFFQSVIDAVPQPPPRSAAARPTLAPSAAPAYSAAARLTMSSAAASLTVGSAAAGSAAARLTVGSADARLMVGSAAGTSGEPVPVTRAGRGEGPAIVESVVLAPWASPAGEAMSLSAAEDVPSWHQRKHERVLRERFDHLLISPHDNVDEARKMASGMFSEFRRAETVSNDAEGRCRLLQEYIRGRTHPAYAKLQVVRVNHSLGHGNSLAHVRGPGQHFCQIAGRHHGKNTIFFMVRRRTGELTQHCFHRQCAARHFSFGVIGHDDVRVLFSPLEFLQKKADELTPEQKGWASKLVQTSKALTVKVTRSKIRHKGKVSAPAVAPPTPNGRPPTPMMSPAPYSYEDVALGDHDDDDQLPTPGLRESKLHPLSPDFVAPLPFELDNQPTAPLILPDASPLLAELDAPSGIAGRAPEDLAGPTPAGIAGRASTGLPGRAPARRAGAPPSGPAERPPTGPAGRPPTGAAGRPPTGPAGRAPTGPAGRAASGIAGREPAVLTGREAADIRDKWRRRPPISLPPLPASPTLPNAAAAGPPPADPARLGSSGADRKEPATDGAGHTASSSGGRQQAREPPLKKRAMEGHPNATEAEGERAPKRQKPGSPPPPHVLSLSALRSLTCPRRPST